MEWVASTLHSTSEHGVSSTTTADAHTSTASKSTELTPLPDLNGLVHLAERRNLVSVRVPSHFKRSLHQQDLLLSADLLHFFFSLTRNFMCYCHFRRVRICIERRPFGSSFLSVRTSFRMHQRGSHWIDFREIWYLRDLNENLSREYEFRKNQTICVKVY